jgi:anti-sigma factor RsiW
MTFPISSPSADRLPSPAQGARFAACPERQTFEAILDGEPPPVEDDALRAHIAGCARCQAELDRLTDSEVLGDWLASAFLNPPWPGESSSLRRVREAVRRLPRNGVGPV